MISESVPQIAMARTRQSTSFDAGLGHGTSWTANSRGAVSTSARISPAGCVPREPPTASSVLAIALVLHERDHAADAGLAAHPAPRERADVEAPTRDLGHL